MKLLIFNLILLVSVSTDLFGSNITSKTDFDKVINKEFPISANGTFDVSNRYGSINITEWDKNAVDIKVIISVKASSQSKADDVFKTINIDFKNDPSYVSAKTEIESSSSWFSSWGSSSDFQINYEVKMPKSLHLKLVNKYGNAYLPDLSNGAAMSISYGDLKMRSIKGTTQLNLSYANSSFENLETFDVEMKYSKLNGDKIQQLTIDSKYSEIGSKSVSNMKSVTKYDTYHLGVVNTLFNDGGYDNFTIDEVKTITIKSAYTDVDIESLIESATISSKFGHIDIDKMSCNKGEIIFDLSYTNVVIGLNGCKDYTLQFEGNYTDFINSGNINANMNRNGNHLKVSAESGNRSKRMDFKMSFGNLRLK